MVDTSNNISISNTLNNFQNELNAKVSSTEDTSKKAAGYSNKTSLGRYVGSVSSDKADAKTIFTKLSIDVGGGGKSITKDQLNNYIDKAKDGKVSIPDEEMNALKTLQKDWDKIADGGDDINYANISTSGHKDTLLSMVPKNTKTKDMSDDAADSIKKINDYLISSALNSSNKGSAKAGYTSMLKTLLTGTTDENDDANANLIATLTNLIADSKAKSTIETEA